MVNKYKKGFFFSKEAYATSRVSKEKTESTTKTSQGSIIVENQKQDEIMTISAEDKKPQRPTVKKGYTFSKEKYKEKITKQKQPKQSRGRRLLQVLNDTKKTIVEFFNRRLKNIAKYFSRRKKEIIQRLKKARTTKTQNPEKKVDHQKSTKK